jgi:hypothetical protein
MIGKIYISKLRLQQLEKVGSENGLLHIIRIQGRLIRTRQSVAGSPDDSAKCVGAGGSGDQITTRRRQG